MSRSSEKLKRFLAWVKQRRAFVIFAGIFTLVAGYGEISEQFHQVYDDAKSLTGLVSNKRDKSPTQPLYSMQLIGLSGRPGVLDSAVAPLGVKKVMILSLLIRNAGDPVVGIMGKAIATLANQGQVDWPHSNRALIMNKGIAVTTEAAVIPIKSSEQEMRGRVDAVFMFGRDLHHLDQNLEVEGEIGWEIVNGKWRFTFIPDGNSAIPAGMNGDIRPEREILPEGLSG